MYIDQKMKKYLFMVAVVTILNTVAQSQQKGKDTCSIVIPSMVAPEHSTRPFSINVNCPLQLFSFQIFDRWGIQIHKQDSLDKEQIISWNYMKLPAGTYLYMLKFKFAGTPEESEKTATGTIGIVR